MLRYENDAMPQLLENRRVAVIGYGSQGHAHALNLRDSGIDVRVGLRPGSPSSRTATDAGLVVTSIAAAVSEADLIAVLVPDREQPQLFRDEIAPHLRPGGCLLFAHGFGIHYKLMEPAVGIDVVMVAPKGPGALVRRTYLSDSGVPALLAVAQDASGSAADLALAYAHALGATRTGVLETTFAEETITDLFGEQAVLCGGVPALITTAFEVLVDAGYQPECAYFECLHELKLIVDLIYEQGLAGMRWAVSETAEYGGYTRGSRVSSPEVRKELEKILRQVQEGGFSQEWLDPASGESLRALREKALEHPIEEVGRRLRRLMRWAEAS